MFTIVIVDEQVGTNVVFTVNGFNEVVVPGIVTQVLSLVYKSKVPVAPFKIYRLTAVEVGTVIDDGDNARVAGVGVTFTVTCFDAPSESVTVSSTVVVPVTAVGSIVNVLGAGF